MLVIGHQNLPCAFEHVGELYVEGSGCRADDVASVIDLHVGEEAVALLAWIDGQRGGTLFRGSDARGRVVELLFDGVRITPVDATFR